MRKTLPAVLVAMCCLIGSSASVAEPSSEIVSAADLSANCDSADSRICSAYIAGYAQGYYYASVGARAGFPACIPHGIPDAQSRLIVAKFLSHHPEMAQQGAPSVIAEALLTTFPCAGAR